MEARVRELRKKDLLNQLSFSHEIHQKVSEQLSAIDDHQPLPVDARVVVLKILLGGHEAKDSKLVILLRRPCQYLESFETLLKDILALPSIKPHLYDTFLQQTFRKIILNAGQYHDPFKYMHQQFSRFNQLAAKLTSVTLQAEKVLLESLCTVFHCPQSKWWIPLLEEVSSQVDKIGEVAEAFFNLNATQMLDSSLVQACLLRKWNLGENIKILNEIIHKLSAAGLANDDNLQRLEPYYFLLEDFRNLLPQTLSQDTFNSLLHFLENKLNAINISIENRELESEVHQLKEIHNRFQIVVSELLDRYQEKISLQKNTVWGTLIQNTERGKLINLLHFFSALEEKNYSKSFRILIADWMMFKTVGFALSFIKITKEPESLDDAIRQFKRPEVITFAEKEKNKFIKLVQANLLDRELFHKLTALLQIKQFNQYLLNRPDKFGVFAPQIREANKVESKNTTTLSL